MAVFTKELRDMLEADTIEKGVANAHLVGLTDYPIFDENYRDVLNEQIIRKFWMRESGLETTSLFRHYLSQRMREIMPYFNQLYLSSRHDFDPFSTISIKTVASGDVARESDSETTNENETTSKSRAVSSTFPQQMLADDGDYAESAQDSASEGAGSGSAKSEGKESTASKSQSETTGFQGSASMLLMAYRETLINIDAMVLARLGDLFMSVWDTDDSRFNNGGYYR